MNGCMMTAHARRATTTIRTTFSNGSPWTARFRRYQAAHTLSSFSGPTSWGLGYSVLTPVRAHSFQVVPPVSHGITSFFFVSLSVSGFAAGGHLQRVGRRSQVPDGIESHVG